MASFWETLTRVDRAKINPALAFRNTLGFGLPLVVGAATHAMAPALATATGALNVSFSDTDEPYLVRARRMIAASILVGFAVACGGIFGQHPTLSIAMVGSWAFGAGLLVALSQSAADLGLISLVTVCVYSATARTLEEAIAGGMLALGGGLLQTALTLALWPIRRHHPERAILSDVYRELEHMASAQHMDAAESPPATATITNAQTTLEKLGASRSVEAERLRSLLNQAERIRVSLLALRRLRSRLRREEATDVVHLLDEAFQNAATVLRDISATLATEGAAPQRPGALDQFAAALDAIGVGHPDAAALVKDTRAQLHTLAGRLRAAADLASGATPAGAASFDRAEARRPMSLRLTGTAATLRANLHLRSTAFRHAVRLSLCVAIATALGRGLGVQRAYWLPMTAAIVLKPDFTSTFTRGILRIGGTFAGLALATALFHLVPDGTPIDVATTISLMFVLRWIGGANYGIFVLAVSALVVEMLAMTGVSPGPVAMARGLNTIMGGGIALIAYAVWPTWERTRTPEAVAATLEAYRDYFAAIHLGYERGRKAAAGALNRARVTGRLARTNLEASVERLTAEPRAGAGATTRVHAILAASHRMIHAMMSLEAGLEAGVPKPPAQEFEAFSEAVERTLTAVATALREWRAPAEPLPNLREAHGALAQRPGAALVEIETDRITNSLDTVAEQILMWVAGPDAGH